MHVCTERHGSHNERCFLGRGRRARDSRLGAVLRHPIVLKLESLAIGRRRCNWDRGRLCRWNASRACDGASLVDARQRRVPHERVGQLRVHQPRGAIMMALERRGRLVQLAMPARRRLWGHGGAGGVRVRPRGRGGPCRHGHGARLRRARVIMNGISEDSESESDSESDSESASDRDHRLESTSAAHASCARRARAQHEYTRGRAPGPSVCMPWCRARSRVDSVDESTPSRAHTVIITTHRCT